MKSNNKQQQQQKKNGIVQHINCCILPIPCLFSPSCHTLNINPVEFYHLKRVFHHQQLWVVHSIQKVAPLNQGGDSFHPQFNCKLVEEEREQEQWVTQ